MSESQCNYYRLVRPFLGRACQALLLGLLAVITGCAAHMREVHQFDPMPRAEVGAEDLDPVILPADISTALKQAEEAYAGIQDTGVDVEQGQAFDDVRDALAGTDIELSVFVALMETHGSILSSASAQAEIAERYRRIWFEDIADGEYARLEIPDPLPPMVEREIHRIQNGYPRAFQRGLDRSHIYRPYIRAELAKAGMPLELEWLAMVESQYTPKIVSWAGAGGMWQFMRPTAQGYNMRIDSYVDERYNWQSSTQAAIKYLQDLHNYFDGDWPLAVTAYNMGQGGLLRAIESTGGVRDLWTLMDTPPASTRMKDESKQFYAKFLASAIVGNDPEAYGFEINPQPSDATVRVAVEGSYLLDDLDRSLGLQPGSMARLNPDLLQEVTPPTGSYSIAVPLEVQARFQQALDQDGQRRQLATSDNASAATVHRVRRGETISQIANNYNISQQELMEANRINSPRSLRVGHELQIPGRQTAPDTQLARGGGAPRNITPTSAQQYRVQRGDTLYDIAQAHEVSVQDLQRWNNIGRGQRLLVGNMLRVAEDAPTPTPMVASVPERRSGSTGSAMRYHTVRRGESPSAIARRYNVPLNELLRWNNLSRNATIHSGQRLVIAVGDDAEPVETPPASAPATEPTPTPAPSPAPSSTPTLALAPPPGPAPARTQQNPTPDFETVTHQVARGETASQIAARYNVPLDDLLSWNNKNRSSVIRVGEELSIRQASSEAASAPSSTPASNTPATHTVTRGETLGAIADRYQVALADLKTWNNKDDRAIVHVGEEVRLRAGAASGSQSGSAPTQQAAPQYQTHTVARGETLSGIAARYNVALNDLRSWNNKGNSATIQVGETLRIQQSGTGTATPAAPAVRTHTVAQGETASAIARRYNVATQELLAWNSKSANDVLRIGEALEIRGASGGSGGSSGSSDSGSGSGNGAVTHTVARGETASAIAARYNVPTQELLAWNNKGSNDVLRVGEEFVIYPNGSNGSASSNAVRHVVSSGQNPTTIARRYGVSVNELFEWNEWPNRHVLQVGDEVRIYQ